MQGLYALYRLKHRSDKKFYDAIPPLLAKKYLKTIYNCHNCSGTLDEGDLDGDHMITVLDIDAVIRWGGWRGWKEGHENTNGKLYHHVTSYCLSSVKG